MSEKVIVTVREGKVQGFKSTSAFSGVEFYSFLGVPYGQSTAGYARFKDPVPVKPWKNILHATVEKGGCLQFSMSKKRVHGSEDCLYNNIYTANIPNKSGHDLKPVVVLLHPGSYMHGSPDPEYFGSPDFVMHNDVVYVGVSYRLHILGSLNLDLEECSGNQGLKDVILSLKWIQNNISTFGGDPDNVTLVGSSTGAALIHYLMISPPANGLFHKGVLMGMYAYCPSSIVQEENFTVAYDLAKKLGYSGAFDKKKLLMFYRRVDMNKVLFARPDRALMNQLTAPFYPCSPFVPILEDRGENAVLPEVSNKQKNLKSMMRIPIMVGFTKYEAALGFLAPFRKLVNENFYKSLRQNYRGWGSKLNDDQLQIIQKRLESYCLNGQPTLNAPLTVKCDIQSSIAVSDLHATLVDVIAADLPSSVYVYKFVFEGNALKMKDYFNYSFQEPLQGTMHGDDFSYWSRIAVTADDKDPLKTYTPKTIEMVNTFTKLICTFAKTGNPNYEGVATQWKPSTVENPCFMNIDSDLSMEDGKLFGDLMEFLEKIKEEFE